MVDFVIEHSRWPLFPVLMTLLAVYLLILGIALAGLVSSLRKRQGED
jgi:hypothetical protein